MNETMVALEEKSMARDVSRGSTKSHANVRVTPLSKLGSPSSKVQVPKSDPINYLTVDKEELFAKVEDLLKSDDEDTNQDVNEDTRDADTVKDTVDEARSVDNWHSDRWDMQKRLPTLDGKEVSDSEHISDDELSESLELEQMDNENLSEMIDSELNKLNDCIGGILETDKGGVESVNKHKVAMENTEYSDETIKGGDVIPSIQEQLLLIQDFSDDDDEEQEDRMQEFEDEEMPGENSSDTVLDGKDVADDEEDQIEDGLDDILNMELPKDITEGGKEQAEDSLDDILNMELPEEDISDDEHDGKWEEISEDVENSVDADISDEEL